jgi:hypothetical protein
MNRFPNPPPASAADRVSMLCLMASRACSLTGTVRVRLNRQVTIGLAVFSS